MSLIRSCDTMAALPGATLNGQTLFAKNSDRPADEAQPLEQHPRVYHAPGDVARCQFISVPETEVSFAHAGSRPYWCWGYEHGFNEHQVVIGNEGLHSHLESSQPKLIGMEILRLGLERSRTAEEAVDVMTGLISRFGQGRFEGNVGAGNYDNGYLAADPKQAFIVEAAGHEWAVKQVDGAAGISNVYSIGTDWLRISPGAEEKAREHGRTAGRLHFADAYSQADAASRPGSHGGRRKARSCALLNQHSGRITAMTMMQILSDHSTGERADDPFREEIGDSGGICFHCGKDGTGGNTAASLVADLCADGSRLPVYWCSLYSPCLGIFLPIFLEGDVPSALALGCADPDSESPWWLFYRLSQTARMGHGDRVPEVRERWRPVQQRLFADAYPIARQARQLMDRGDEATARQVVTRTMDRSVKTACAIAREMLEEFGEAG